jgi:DNA ligase-1
MTFKPMLSGKAPDDLSTLKYPLMVSPKLDGIRAIVLNGVIVSRNLKPIPNEYVQFLYGLQKYEGYDGELIVGDPTDPDCFRATTSGVMSRHGMPEVKFHVFDKVDSKPWHLRFTEIETTNLGSVYKVPHHLVHFANEITQFEEMYLEQGYEGIMIRHMSGPYKMGRSTTKEGWLLKLKRFEDSEALVLGMEEKMHNANEATTNALGHTERSSHQENLIPLNTMGALIVRDLETGVEFNIGTGFDDNTRDWWWQREHIDCERMNNGGFKKLGLVHRRVVKYQYFPSGSKDKPRFPTYLGLREDL